MLDCLLSESPVIGKDECDRLDDGYKDVVAQGRWQDLTLCQGGARVAVGPAAKELLSRLQPLAELLDSWQGGETYQTALSAQQAKIEGDDWSVPSARVMEAMSASGLGHRDWVLSVSKQHKQTLTEKPLSADTLARFEAMSRDSKAEQAAMEAADTQSFAEFLDDYLKS